MPKKNINPLKLLKTAAIAAAVFFLLLSLIPYLIPMPQDAPCRPKEELISPAGKYFEADGKQIYFEDYGRADSPDVVILVHGFGGSIFSFRQNIASLVEQEKRVIAVDLLGYGLSDKEYLADYSHPAHARRLKALMDELNIVKATLAGHSMGSSVIVHFTRLYPDSVDSLILIAPAIDAKNIKSNIKAARIINPLVKYPPFKRIARLALRGYFFPNNTEKVLASAYFDDSLITPAIYHGYLDRIIYGDWDLALLGSLRDYRGNIIDFSLSEFKQDILIIAGENDTWIPHNQILLVHEQFINSSLQVIPQAGHLVMEEKPNEFNQIVKEFFSRL